MFEVKIGSDGDKTCLVTITGQLSANLPKPEPILLFSELNFGFTSKRRLRLDGIQFSIQEKMGFNLWWTMPEGKRKLIMPMESRGGYDFERILALVSPPEASGLELSSFKVNEKDMSFLIMLDMTKL